MLQLAMNLCLSRDVRRFPREMGEKMGDTQTRKFKGDFCRADFLGFASKMPLDCRRGDRMRAEGRRRRVTEWCLH
jgi:hypothetical protein